MYRTKNQQPLGKAQRKNWKYVAAVLCIANWNYMDMGKTSAFN